MLFNYSLNWTAKSYPGKNARREVTKRLACYSIIKMALWAITSEKKRAGQGS